MKLDTKAYEAKMVKAISNYEENLSSIRAGQANSAILKLSKSRKKGCDLVLLIKDGLIYPQTGEKPFIGDICKEQHEYYKKGYFQRA